MLALLALLIWGEGDGGGSPPPVGDYRPRNPSVSIRPSIRATPVVRASISAHPTITQ